MPQWPALYLFQKFCANNAFLIFKAPNMKINIFENSIGPDEVADELYAF